MNTDNYSVAGITIDYGPCAFMEAFQYNFIIGFDVADYTMLKNDYNGQIIYVDGGMSSVV